MKALHYITLILICKSVILSGATFASPYRVVQNVISCCCSADFESATNMQQCCMPHESVPCQSSQDSNSSCSEQCSQRCNSFFYKVLLFCEQQTLGLNIQKTFSLTWLSEKGPSLFHSPESPPPKV